MVIFTCNNCGDSVQKPRVEKHYFKCRGYKNLTCVDCLKDFRDEEYSTHTKCMTEDERYSAKGTFPNGIVNKGEAKQEQWTNMIRNIVDSEANLSNSLRNMLQRISTYSNIPRKKPKFLNFLNSTLGRQFNIKDGEMAWDIIEKYKKEAASENKKETNGNGKKTETVEQSEKRKHEDEEEAIKCKKVKANEAQEEGNVADSTTNPESFSFKVKILEILHKKRTIPLDKLEKKVARAYRKWSQNQDAEVPQKKLLKKLKKIDNAVVENGVVTLTEPQ